MEPKHRTDTRGKYLVRTGGVVLTVVSFDNESEAEAWGRWNNFGEENPYEIITSLQPHKEGTDI